MGLDRILFFFVFFEPDLDRTWLEFFASVLDHCFGDRDFIAVLVNDGRTMEIHLRQIIRGLFRVRG